ncbi:histamine H3 receptor-like [Dendropsophus ebraccatus]|uniref:histamine H3 receptor-like n=1 Tax=Dendropsophus ebraccatus TaxID=150705 RepID=UPI0038311AA4
MVQQFNMNVKQGISQPHDKLIHKVPGEWVQVTLLESLQQKEEDDTGRHKQPQDKHRVQQRSGQDDAAADDTKLGKEITTEEDNILQKDLEKLEAWAEKWQMTFIVDKCKMNPCSWEDWMPRPGENIADTTVNAITVVTVGTSSVSATSVPSSKKTISRIIGVQVTPRKVTWAHSTPVLHAMDSSSDEWESDGNFLSEVESSAAMSGVNSSTVDNQLGNKCLVNNEEQFQHYGQFTPSVSILLAVLMILMVLATVLGNALVILAFVVDKGLRTQGNFFFLNLAIADFLVGGFCIPLYIPYVLTGQWKFGKGLCKLWLVMDYLLCTASVFNIVLISYDRFISVTKAVSYRAQKGMTRNAVLKMLTVWVAAFLLYGPAIISWEYIARATILPEGECYVEFYYNWYFLMIASTIEFFTPFISVTYFNLSIYINIKKRTMMRNEELAQGQEHSERPHIDVKKQTTCLSTETCPAGQRTQRFRGQMLDLNISQDLPPLQVEVQTKKHQDCFYKTVENACSNVRTDMASSIANRFRLSRDKRVAKSLAIIVCVFGLCWAPYTLLMIIRAACHGRCVQHYLYEISFWLLWLNSAINPILYPLCHMSFRKAFMKLLCPGKVKIHPHIFM